MFCFVYSHRCVTDPRVKMLERTEVEKGVEAVLALVKKNTKAVTLVEYPDPVELQFTLKRIVHKKRKVLALNLPRSIHHKAREVCVFVKDLDEKSREYEDTVEHYEDIFKANNVTQIHKIVPLKALKTDYSQAGAKKTLSRAYELFLADKCVFGTLPAILGKTFFSKKSTVPVGVDLGVKNLQKEVARVVDNPRCEMNPNGNCHIVTVGHSWMEKEDIVANVLAAANQIAEKLHGGQPIIRNISIKSGRTMAIPLYLNLSDPGEVSVEEVKVKPIDECIDDVTTVTAGPVRITADGFVEILGDTPPPHKAGKRQHRPGAGNQRKRGRDRSQSAGGKKSKVEKKRRGVEIKEETVEVKQETGDQPKAKSAVKKTAAKKTIVKTLNKKKGSKMMRFSKGQKKPK